MDTSIRRHRASDTPVRRERVITAAAIKGAYLEVLRSLDPYLHFKYATIPWLHYLSGATVEYSVFRKYLGYMRAAPNHYIGCPEQQLASPNVDRKTLVFELRERGLNALIERGIIPKRASPEPDAKPSKSQRNHAFALHRSNSYYHEMIVDLGYHAPLRHLCDRDGFDRELLLAGLDLRQIEHLIDEREQPLARRVDGAAVFHLLGRQVAGLVVGQEL